MTKTLSQFPRRRKDGTYKTYDQTRGAIHRAIMAGEDFKAGNLRGTRMATQSDGWRRFPEDPALSLSLYRGQLPNEDRIRVLKDNPTYVVWSYSTPIAWYVPDEIAERYDEGLEHNVKVRTKSVWVVPDTKYSNTTTRHQGIVRVALSLANVRE
jgi:hypothetical protein